MEKDKRLFGVFTKVYWRHDAFFKFDDYGKLVVFVGEKERECSIKLEGEQLEVAKESFQEKRIVSFRADYEEKDWKSCRLRNVQDLRIACTLL